MANLKIPHLDQLFQKFPQKYIESFSREKLMLTFSPNSVAFALLTVLAALLLIAAWNDVKSYRIPNKLTFFGIAIGLLANTSLPEGNGFASTLPGALGLFDASKGLIAGFFLLFPLYLLRAMGAGDVKLIAMVGAFLGASSVIAIGILTFLIGGLLAIALAVANGKFNTLLANLWTMTISSHYKIALKENPTFDNPVESSGKLPYAVPITLGTFTYIYLNHAFPNIFSFI